MAFLGSILGPAQRADGPSAESVDAASKSVTSQLAQQNAFITALQAQNGIQNQSDVFAQQQALATQLQQQTLGQGPNPAQAQLAQNTAANTAQQAALAASQRGASANAGLTSRNAAMAGAGMQQQATGQAATLQAQQQIAAQQALQQQQAQMAGLATNQVGQLAGAQQMAGNTALQNQSSLLGAQSNANNTNLQYQNMQNQMQMGLLQGIGSAATAVATGGASKAVPSVGSGAKMGSQIQAFAKGGKVQAPTTEVEATHASRRDMGWGKVIMKAEGGKVPGKAEVAGDSLENDKVPAMLSPGEIIIPRSVVQGGPEAVLAFAKKILEEDNE